MKDRERFGSGVRGIGWFDLPAEEVETSSDTLLPTQRMHQV
jgi:hypothetical protein